MYTPPPVATTSEIDDLLKQDAVVCQGLSGGKDSVSCLLAVHRHLNSIGHKGPRLAIHSDLGNVEWEQSITKCQEVADLLGWELIIVRRAAGGMMQRWSVRWQNNVQRYKDLSCVSLILPWSTPSMRFCTSELKNAPIRSELRRRFPTSNIVNATGIRREESPNRAKMPVAKLDPAGARKGYVAYQWNPIIDWKIQSVWDEISNAGLEPHEAYSRYNMSRVSCSFCIMSNSSDMYNSSTCEANQPVYRKMVELEVTSTFAFQSNKWLGDVNPGLLSSETLDRLAVAKAVSAERKALEACIPKHLLYSGGWPTCIPTLSEAAQLGEIRREVAAGVGLSINCTDADSIVARYQELMALKVAKGGTEKEDGPILIPAFQIPQQHQLSF